MNAILAKKINAMALADQKMRARQKNGSKLDSGIDKANIIELKKIVEEYGWPTISLVGKKASFNAWLLIQHGDHDRKFQEVVLKLLKKIDSESGDIDKANIAYLTDRLLVAKKKKQRFGTQFNFNKKGMLILHPISNEKHVDELRKKYHLPPVQDFIDMASTYNQKITKKMSGSKV